MNVRNRIEPMRFFLRTSSLLASLMLSSTALADSTQISTGPVTQWAYGWKASATGAFTQYNTTKFSWYGLPTWSDVNANFPLVTVNNTNATASYSPSFHVPKGQLIIHPGPDKASAVRWTADESGQYQVQGFFDGLDPCTPTTRVHVVLNSSTVLFSQPLVGFTTVSFNLSRALSRDDTLEFVVDNGGNGYLCDTVGMASMITRLH